MISGLFLVSNGFMVIGEGVDDGVMVTESSSLSFIEIVLFAVSGKTFNDSSVRCSFDVAVVVVEASISSDNDDDVVEWGDKGTFVFDCNDNVAISETGVVSVVAVNRKRKERDEQKGHKNEYKSIRRRGHQMTKINQLNERMIVGT